MGQYHMIVNLDRHEYIYCCRLSPPGLSLMAEATGALMDVYLAWQDDVSEEVRASRPAGYCFEVNAVEARMPEGSGIGESLPLYELRVVRGGKTTLFYNPDVFVATVSGPRFG